MYIQIYLIYIHIYSQNIYEYVFDTYSYIWSTNERVTQRCTEMRVGRCSMSIIGDEVKRGKERLKESKEM